MKQSNSVYWESKKDRAAQAKKHIQETNDLPLGKSIIYDNAYHRPILPKETSSVGTCKVCATDTVSAIFEAYDGNNRVCALNFASYLNPGGKYLEGSCAQEESLCHESNLYQNLASVKEYYAYNSKHKNKCFYESRAIYTEDVCFVRDGKTIKADVLTCAAPNIHAVTQILSKEWYASQKIYEAYKFNTTILKERIGFVCGIMREMEVNTAILGAWGCGVFGQNPKEVAEIFKEAFKNSGINTVYAIPGDFHQENLKAFKDVFSA